MKKVDGTEALERVRDLRRAMTPAEQLRWKQLRARRLGGFKFKRQVWVGPYIADFHCWEAKLIVEVDGSQHAQRTAYDRQRTKYLKDEGFRVLRFWNNQVLEELEGVLTAILVVIEERVPSPSQAWRLGPLPLPEGERENRSHDAPPKPSPVQGEGGARRPQAGGRVRAR